MELSNTRKNWKSTIITRSNFFPNLSFSYETGNGIKLEGSGFTKKAVVPQYDESGARQEDVEKDVLVQVGSYSYTAPDGQVITVKYIADENGFQPQGDHIPTPPTVPEAIANSLNQQANIQQQQQFGQQTRNGQQQQQFGQQTRNGQQQQQFGEGRSSTKSNVLASPQSSNFAATQSTYPQQKQVDRFADFSG